MAWSAPGSACFGVGKRFSASPHHPRATPSPAKQLLRGPGCPPSRRVQPSAAPCREWKAHNPAASAAGASGFLQVALSKATRPRICVFAHSPRLLGRFRYSTNTFGELVARHPLEVPCGGGATLFYLVLLNRPLRGLVPVDTGWQTRQIQRDRKRTKVDSASPVSVPPNGCFGR